MESQGREAILAGQSLQSAAVLFRGVCELCQRCDPQLFGTGLYGQSFFGSAHKPEKSSVSLMEWLTI